METVYEVKCNMFEIYNEIVRDLLNPQEKNRKKGLRVREHPTKGFYGELLLVYLFQLILYLLHQLKDLKQLWSRVRRTFQAG